MSVARLARDVLPQPWLLHHLIKHVAPRVRAEADRELQPLARTVIERRKLERGERPRCVMSTWAHWDAQFNAAEYGSDHGCPVASRSGPASRSRPARTTSASGCSSSASNGPPRVSASYRSPASPDPGT